MSGGICKHRLSFNKSALPELNTPKELFEKDEDQAEKQEIGILISWISDYPGSR